MLELTNDNMPEVVVHEYSPLLDSSDMGPPDWQVSKDCFEFKRSFMYYFISDISCTMI